jgi:hypothetical protein
MTSGGMTTNRLTVLNSGGADISGNLVVSASRGAVIHRSAPGATSAPILSLDTSGHEIIFLASMNDKGYNNISKENDKGIIFRNKMTGPAEPGNLVIAPHTDGVMSGIRITSDGKVGINKALPTATLDVSGSLNVSAGATIHGNLAVNGDLTVTGSITGNLTFAVARI